KGGRTWIDADGRLCVGQPRYVLRRGDRGTGADGGPVRRVPEPPGDGGHGQSGDGATRTSSLASRLPPCRTLAEAPTERDPLLPDGAHSEYPHGLRRAGHVRSHPRRAASRRAARGGGRLLDGLAGLRGGGASMGKPGVRGPGG